MGARVMKKAISALTVVGALATAAPAQAAVMDSVYNFAASFDRGPNAKIDGTITLSFDLADSSVPITFKGFTSDALTGYTVIPDISDRLVYLGNCPNTRCNAHNGSSEFFMAFRITPDGGVRAGSAGLVYTATGKPGIFTSNSFTVSRVAAAVPEPSTWMMMILGFAAVGYSMRRRAVLRFV